MFAKKERTYTNRCAYAETQQELRIGCIKGLKSCDDPYQKDGRDHEETGDEDLEECVASSPHATGCLSGIFEFLQVPPVE